MRVFIELRECMCPVISLCAHRTQTSSDVVFLVEKSRPVRKRVYNVTYSAVFFLVGHAPDLFQAGEGSDRSLPPFSYAYEFHHNENQNSSTLIID